MFLPASDYKLSIANLARKQRTNCSTRPQCETSILLLVYFTRSARLLTAGSSLPCYYPYRSFANTEARMIRDQLPLPPGYAKCHVCGEFNGSTAAVNLSWGDHFRPAGKISVTCLCHGVLCPRCKTTLIHRPVSNTYYPEANEVWHWPYFAALAGCAECRSAGRTPDTDPA